MSAFVPFNCFLLDLGNKVHNLGTDVLKIYLTNTAPSLSNTVYNTPADLTTGGGYTAGGLSIGSNTWSQSSGNATLVAGTTPVTFTATSGFGPFRYAVLYNSTPGSKPLIGYWDIGAPVTLAAAEHIDVNLSSPLLSAHF